MKSIVASTALLVLGAIAGVQAQNSTSVCAAPLPFAECLDKTNQLAATCSTDLACQCRTSNVYVFCYVNFCGGVGSPHPDYPAATCKRNQVCAQASQNITQPGWSGSCSNIPTNGNGTTSPGNGTTGNNTGNGNNNSTSGKSSSAAVFTRVGLSGFVVAAVTGSAFLL
ncbi:hypothetical protein SpCBS45565_g05669 [Spizellomyces sp. 'palustris']|nr:hypothetical protein SpCBS45565_g05669 [Spizellomyces sp. 'palustris']